jgi:hypothetical protein
VTAPADRDDATPELQARVDELLAAMTVEEKAGQLTQYFYLGSPDATVGASPQEAGEVEGALARGEVGSLLFVTDPSEINRLQRLAVEGNRHGVPVLFGFDVIHGLRTVLPVPIAMAARRSSAGRRWPAGRRAPSASTGRLRRWSTSPVTRDGGASSRGRARTPISAP